MSPSAPWRPTPPPDLRILPVLMFALLAYVLLALLEILR